MKHFKVFLVFFLQLQHILLHITALEYLTHLKSFDVCDIRRGDIVMEQTLAWTDLNLWTGVLLEKPRGIRDLTSLTVTFFLVFTLKKQIHCRIAKLLVPMLPTQQYMNYCFHSDGAGLCLICVGVILMGQGYVVVRRVQLLVAR